MYTILFYNRMAIGIIDLMELQYKKVKLKNGIRVITVPMKSTAAVTSLVLVGVGSHYDTKKLAGLSHYLEHLVFKGSKKYPSALNIASILDGLGAAYNAVTTNEYTGFYITTVSNKVGIALDVMSDYLKNPLFKLSEVEKERGPILEEVRMHRDMPSSDIWRLFIESLYGDQPAGRDVAGDEKSIANIKRADVKSFFNRYYKGENIVVVFAGDVSHKKGLELARRFFGDISGGERQIKESVKSIDKNPSKIVGKNKNTEQTHIVLGFDGLKETDKDFYTLWLTANILGGGMSSRLFFEVREKRGLAYTISAHSSGGSDYGFFAIYGGINNKKTKEALHVIIKELRNFKKSLVSASELKRAKDRIIGLTLLGLEISQGVAFDFGTNEIILNKIETPQEHIKIISSIKASDIRRVANDIFKKDTMRLAFIGPHKDKKEFENILNTI